jgi:phage shock protein A
MNDRELLEYIAAQVGTLTHEVIGLKQGQSRLEQGQSKLEKKVDNIEKKVDNLEIKVDNLEIKVDNLEIKVDNLEKKVDTIDKTVIRIENDNNTQHTALFDGWKQNTQQLERIEKEVTRQEEIIMRRIK